MTNRFRLRRRPLTNPGRVLGVGGALLLLDIFVVLAGVENSTVLMWGGVIASIVIVCATALLAIIALLRHSDTPWAHPTGDKIPAHLSPLTADEADMVRTDEAFMADLREILPQIGQKV